MSMKTCRIDFNLNGMPGHVTIDAEDSTTALLQWLQTVPRSAAIKAIVRVLLPAESQ